MACDKTRERIQNLIDHSTKARPYFSDAYSAYAEICYEGTHTSLKNKSQTYTVEGVNSDLRHYIPALHRRSKCFFKSIETMKAVVGVFVHAFNRFAAAKHAHPHLKRAFSLTNYV